MKKPETVKSYEQMHTNIEKFMEKTNKSLKEKDYPVPIKRNKFLSPSRLAVILYILSFNYDLTVLSLQFFWHDFYPSFLIFQPWVTP